MLKEEMKKKRDKDRERVEETKEKGCTHGNGDLQQELSLCNV